GRVDPPAMAMGAAARVDVALRSLVRYAGSDWRHVQPWMLLTDSHRYVDQCILHGLEKLREDPRCVRMVLPGNVVGDKSMGQEEAQAIVASVVWHRYQMPAYPLIAADGHGVTLAHLGAGPSHATTLPDPPAVLRPHCWLMIGPCGAPREPPH
ncbi:AMP nucleosidase, partial [Pseudomonas syringae]